MYTFEILCEYIKFYNNIYKFEKEMKNILKNKTRLPNFPEHISENLVKFYYQKFKNEFPTWKEKFGDLNIGIKRIEVKASINLDKSLISFGPKEYFDIIYFVDCKDIDNEVVKIYECDLSFYSNIWQNLQINKSETFKDQILQKRRPRMNFKILQNQLGDNIKLVFDDTYLKLQPNY